jgi:hypothetical protein
MMLLLAIAVPACAGCHPAEAKSHAPSGMARALVPAAESAILRANPELTRKDGAYEWNIRRDGTGSIYSVTDGKQTVSARLKWAFGAGTMGQTYVYERNGGLYEATLSYYSSTKALDFTPGHLELPRTDIEAAAGRRIDAAEARRCFGCHAEGGSEPYATGVQCTHCHVGANQHAGSLNTKPIQLSKNTAEEVSNLCGSCHRTWQDIAANGPMGLTNVRFQPYRLANSKCYDGVDRRIACTACHNPHQELSHRAADYDSKCLACHATGKKCPVGRKDCVTCHMPKTDVPGLHFRFTDHWIRVVRAGEPFPQ